MRIKKNRFIQMAPHFDGFKPQGLPKKKDAVVVIKFEEYEALKLCDYESLTQAEAAVLMKVSRPTLTRIYKSVREKIAQAFVEGKTIIFEGGSVEMADWKTCHHCKSSFTSSIQDCPLCMPKEDKIVGGTIAIASEGDGLAANISLQFGRCQYYCLCNLGTLEYTFVENPAFVLTEKAGCTAAVFLKEHNVKVIVAGRFGTKTMDVLQKNNIQMIIPLLPKSVGDLIKH